MQPFRTYLITEGRVADEAINRVRKVWNKRLETVREFPESTDRDSVIGNIEIYIEEFPKVIKKAEKLFTLPNGKPNQKWVTKIASVLAVTGGYQPTLAGGATEDEIMDRYTHMCTARGITNDMLDDDFAPLSAMANEIPAFRTMDFEKFSLPHIRSIMQGMVTEVHREKERTKKATIPMEPGDHDRILIDFGNGWKWIALGKGKCTVEAEAMGHCGNTAHYVDGDEIFSLRELKKNENGADVWVYHLTFIWNSHTKTIGEARERGNHKPGPKYRSMIMALLELPFIHGFNKILWTGGQSTSFTFDDLTEQQQQVVLSKNPRAGDVIEDMRAALKAAGGRAQDSVEGISLNDFDDAIRTRIIRDSHYFETDVNDSIARVIHSIATNIDGTIVPISGTEILTNSLQLLTAYGMDVEEDELRINAEFLTHIFVGIGGDENPWCTSRAIREWANDLEYGNDFRDTQDSQRIASRVQKYMEALWDDENSAQLKELEPVYGAFNRKEDNYGEYMTAVAEKFITSNQEERLRTPLFLELVEGCHFVWAFDEYLKAYKARIIGNAEDFAADALMNYRFDDDGNVISED